MIVLWKYFANTLQTHVLFSADHGKSKHVEGVCGAVCIELFFRNFDVHVGEHIDWKV